MKRLSLFLVVLGVFALVISGCNGEEEDEASEDEATSAKPAEGDEAEEATEEGDELDEAEAAIEEGDDVEGTEVAEIGVPECDEYVEKYMTCIDEHVPEETSAELLDAFKASTEAWQASAEDEASREMLAETCTQALEAAKESMAAYECEW